MWALRPGTRTGYARDRVPGQHLPGGTSGLRGVRPDLCARGFGFGPNARGGDAFGGQVTKGPAHAPNWPEALGRVTGGPWRPGGTGLTDRALDILRPRPDCLCLDVGCGPGHTVAHLRAAHRLRALGLDRWAWPGAREAGPLVQGLAAQIPLCSGCLDLVLAECVLSLAGPLDKVLEEIARVLRSGGGLAVLDFVSQSGGIGSRAGFEPSCCLAGAPDRESWERALAKAGFRLLAQEDHSLELKQLAARLILAHGSISAFAKALGPDNGGGCRIPARAGYHLFVAVKENGHGC
ncbi:MAG: class I SAM-dependent methyltransferase [Deltaproteobacteria bacterium]|nr:class I SAM-dependent methyltransferase [Deltaproteobacteria bacterium]